MIRRHGRGLRMLLMLADGVLAAITLVVASALRFGGEWDDHWRGIVSDPGALLFIYAVGWVGALAYFGLYRVRARWSLRSEALDLARATLVMAAITFAVLFWFRLPDISRTFLVILFPVQWLVTLISRIGLREFFRRLRAIGLNQRFVLMVGTGPRALAFATKLETHRDLGLTITGFIDDEGPLVLPEGRTYLGALDTIEDILHDQVIDEVAICLSFDQWDRIDAIAQICEDEGKIVRVPMDVLDHAFAAGRLEELDGTPVFSLISGPDRVLGLAIKRLVDIVVAAMALIVLSPVFVLIALWIRLDDGAPALFRQIRVGLHGRRFEVLKFRTMHKDAEAHYPALVARSDPRAFKLHDDPRITATGKFLRRTSLDELPQLWNVLRGTMSLVGPRPAPPREVKGYDIWHRRRLSMKPGITGLWQVTARRSDDFDRRAELDLEYIDRWSFWLDMRILARTVPAAFDGR